MPTLFEPGAPPARGLIPLSVPHLAGREWEYVKECLDTGWVSSVGAYVDRFEKTVADYVGAKHAVAMVNGTSALHIALLVAGVEPDDEVLLSALTFIAPANAIRYVGAWPVFIDAEPEYWQIAPAKILEFLQNECAWRHGELRNRTTGRRVKAIIPVHILGHPVDLGPIVEIAGKFQLAVIEDATESIGAKYRGQPIGRSADIACFSFNGNKMITTGGGGMLVTNNAAWAQRARYLSTQAKDDPLEYVHHHIGYNYRLTNLLAALGCAQMEQLDDFVAAKRRIAHRYTEAFSGAPGIRVMQEAEWAFSAFWMFTIRIDATLYGLDSRALLHRLTAANIQARPLWQPLHRSPAHLASPSGRIETADTLHRECLSLPCSVGLTAEDQERVIQAVRHLSIAA
jgi:perosamine synthetase